MFQKTRFPFLLLCLLALCVTAIAGVQVSAETQSSSYKLQTPSGECMHHNWHIAFTGDCASAPSWQFETVEQWRFQIVASNGRCVTRVIGNQARLKPCAQTTAQLFGRLPGCSRCQPPTHLLFLDAASAWHLGVGGYGDNRLHFLDVAPDPKWIFATP